MSAKRLGLLQLLWGHACTMGWPLDAVGLAFPVVDVMKGYVMFSQYREQIEQLRASDKNFSRLCDKHSALDAEVEALVQRKSPALQVQVESLKKQKLAVKEEIYNMLRDAEPMLALKQQKNYVNLNKLAEMSGVRLNV